MPIRPDRARVVLPRVDPTRLRWGLPVGLRDGAILALIAAGLSAEEISELRGSAITMSRGCLVITLRRHGLVWQVALTTDLGARLLAWLTERRLWAEPAPVFMGFRGPLTTVGIHQVYHRYWRRRKACR